MEHLQIFLVLVLISSVVGDADNSTASKNITKSAKERSEPTSQGGKCLKTLNDITQELSSTVPPLNGTIDNYNSIARALFPGFNLPSLYIKVTLQFIVNDTGPGTRVLSSEVQKFTWSESCIFVSNVCLDAMTVLSLGTVYPQRRQTELVLSVHKICEGAGKANGFEDNTEMWRYVLLGMQDISNKPDVSEPDVSTAQCVVSGHEGDVNLSLDYPDEWYNYREWWIVSTSCLLAITICWYAGNWIKTLKKKKEALITTFLSAVFWLFILSLVTISLEIWKIIQCRRNISIALIVHCVFYFVFLLANIIIYKRSLDGTWVMFDGTWVMLPCIYQVIHHLLWVLCAGIPADPSRAIPLFLCECLVVFVLVCALYYYYAGGREGGLQLGFSLFAIYLTVFTVAISFFGRSAADIKTTNNIFQIIMFGVLVWAIKNSGLAPNNNGNADELQNVAEAGEQHALAK